jgi:hypothetical protein
VDGKLEGGGPDRIRVEIWNRRDRLVMIGACSHVSPRISRPALDGHGRPYAALATVVSAGLGWLILCAAGEDPYYEPDDLSRWDHATKNGLSLPLSPVLVVAATVIAPVSIVALVHGARSSTRARTRRLVMLTTASACLALIVAWLPLTTGH